jgi:hypothetical protein
MSAVGSEYGRIWLVGGAVYMCGRCWGAAWVLSSVLCRWERFSPLVFGLFARQQLVIGGPVRKGGLGAMLSHSHVGAASVVCVAVAQLFLTRLCCSDC